MRAAVKYCGGCNPRYDRVGFRHRLEAAFSERVDFVNASEEGPFDLVLVVCGCTAACADHRGLEGKHGKRVVHGENQYPAVAEWIQGQLEESKG